MAGPEIKPEPLALEADVLQTALRGPALYDPIHLWCVCGDGRGGGKSSVSLGHLSNACLIVVQIS